MNQIMEWREKDIRAAVITIVNKVKQNIFSMNKNLSREIRHLSREIKIIKYEANGSHRNEN